MPRTVPLRTGRLSVIDYRCAAGPGDKPFAEQHTRHSISFVRKGAFGCCCRGRSFELVVGSMLVGHPGDEYMCTHDHHLGGDECLSFQFDPELVGDIGDDALAWRCGTLPPVPALVVLGEMAQAVAQGRASIGLDEVGMLLAARLVELVTGRATLSTVASVHDRRRAVRAAIWIEAKSADPIDLESAAAEAGINTFHFLRVFTRVIGLTPHQYLIRCRLRHAAQLLAEESMTVTHVAYEAGFGDLSNFVRTFGRAAGMSPLRYRRLAQGQGSFLQERSALPALP